MAIQSKTVAKLKSEVLQISSRPYELIEYNPDKLKTGEINPELINSDITTYERSISGTVIIDKNLDNLLNQKMLISLNTTKISNARFNQIIDTEFQDFPPAADASLMFLEGKLALLESKIIKGSTENSALKAQIADLKSQIDKLKEINKLISQPIINEIPDSMPYGIELNADESGFGSMLLSKNRKALAKLSVNSVYDNTGVQIAGGFRITLGNYNAVGTLIDGEEKITFAPKFSASITNKELTNGEAIQYLANHPDLELYFNGPTDAATTALATIKAVANLNQVVPEYLRDSTMVKIKQTVTVAQKQEKRDNFNTYLNAAYVQPGASNDPGITKKRREWIANDLGINFDATNNTGQGATSFTQQTQRIQSRFSYWADKFKNPDDPTDVEAKRISTFYNGLYGSTNTLINQYTTQYKDWQLPGETIITEPSTDSANYKLVQQQLKVVRDKLAQDIIDNLPTTDFTSVIYTIPYNSSKQIPINDIIFLPTRNILKQKKGVDLIAAAKNHWKNWARTRPAELEFRSYLSDAQARAYLNNYGDLRDAFGDDLLQAKRHWNFNGLNEGRSVSMGTSLLRIWRNEVQKKGYIEIVKTNPWHVRWSSDYIDLSKSSRIFLDDNGILYLYDKDKIVWQSFNE